MSLSQGGAFLSCPGSVDLGVLLPHLAGAVVEEVTWAENKALVGEAVEVLVAVGEGRKDERTGWMSGRARDGRLVHFATGELAAAIRPGDIVHTVVTYAAPHHLNADGAPLHHRRTRAGDAREPGRAPRTPGVLLGMPAVRPSC